MTNRTSVRRPSLIAGLLCLTPLSAMADDDRLGTINITAVREAPSVAPAMPQTVITREEIERSQARSLEGLLTGRAGLNVTNLGGPGKQSNVSIWGQSASRTAVFVDGMRIGSVSAGQSYLEHIPLAQVERIEIVRGPRSGQWGADAGGGVIQIFTREGAEDGVHLSGGIGAGSRGHREADAHVGGRQGAFDYSLGVAHQETDGFDACENTGPFTSPCYGDEPDDDGYERDSVQGQAGYRFGDGGQVRAHFLASSAEVEYDGTFQDFTEVEQRTFGLSASTGRIGFWQLRARAGRHVDDQDSYKDDDFASRFDTQRDTLSIANDFFIGSSTTVTFGGDQTEDDLTSTTDYAETSRRNQALFTQLNTNVADIDVQAALRRDFNEQFGTANTGSLDLAYALTDAWTLTAGHGTAFTAPSFNLLYYPFGFGNPDLEPERTRTTRAGVDWQHGPYALELSAFRSKVRGFITPGENPENIERAEIDGAEIAGSLSLGDWQTGMALTYLSTEDEQSGDRLPRQPRWSGRLDVDRAIGAFTVGGTLRGQSDSEGGPWAEDNQGFVTADLRGAYRINADWRIEARVENLFDRDYQVVRGYNQAPRGVFVSLRYGR